MDPQRRDRLEALLRERGELLRPTPSSIDAIIQRCAQTPRVIIGEGGKRISVRLPSSAQSRTTQRPELMDLVAGATPSGALPVIAGVQVTTPHTIVTATATAPTIADLPTAVDGAKTVAKDDAGSDRLAPGTVIAGYRIDGLLGAGGMGQVYRATQLSMHRPVAFKVLSTRLAGDRAFRERFLREAHAAGRLHHPNLIAVHDAGEAGAMMFFSMEIVTGSSLRDYVARGPLPEAAVISIARQALNALGYAHRQGVIHRDIKPDNLMLTDDGVLKVADLGLSRLADAETDSGTTVAGTIMGTPHYMAPEQGRDAHAAGAPADLYSLGATLFHLVTGQVPFSGPSPLAVVMAHATAPLVFPANGPRLSPRLHRFIAMLMMKNPKDRPTSAEAALALLEGEHQPPSRTSAEPRAARSWRRVVLYGLVALAIIIGLAVTAGARQRRVHNQQSAQDQAIAEVNGLMLNHQFADALRRARTLSEHSPADSAGQNLPDEVAVAWSAWSASAARMVLADVRRLTEKRRWKEAHTLLRTINADRLAPEWQVLYQDMEFRLLDAVENGDSATAPGPAVLPPPLSFQATQLFRRESDHWWAGFAHPENMARGDEDDRRIFQGSGSAARKAYLNPEQLTWAAVPAEGRELGLTVAVTGDGHLTLHLGLHYVRFTSDAVVVHADASVKPGEKAGDIRDKRIELTQLYSHVFLRSRSVGSRQVVEISANRRDWTALGGNGPLRWEWQLDGGEAAVRLNLIPVLPRAAGRN